MVKFVCRNLFCILQWRYDGMILYSAEIYRDVTNDVIYIY
jgi:hypothetical protein